MIERMEPDDLAEVIDEELFGGGKSSGGGKKNKPETWGKRGRQKSKTAEGAIGQRINAVNRKEKSQKSATDEVNDVLTYLARKDRDDNRMPASTKYLKWLEGYINKPETIGVTDEECGDWEQFTASVHAGGGGRQTCNNARARTHLITSIRAGAEESRRAEPNQELVMKKLREKLIVHVNNWRKLMMATRGEMVETQKLETLALELMSKL